MPGNVLFIAFYFPPLAGAGVQRPLRFVRYLPEFGWLPTVLSVSEDCTYPFNDPSLLDEVDKNIKIIRAIDPLDRLAGHVARIPGLSTVITILRQNRSTNVSRGFRDRFLKYSLLEIPDAKISWMYPACKSALEYIRKNPIDMIYTTSAPYTSHLVGCWLRMKTGLPWVADFRDEWTENFTIHYPTGFHKWLSYQFERMVLKKANHVVSTSGPITQLLMSRLSDEQDKFSTITNGYDQGEIDRASDNVQSTLPTIREQGDNAIFRLVYTGSLYEPPVNFLEAVESLLDEKDIPPERIRIRLIGHITQLRTRNPEWEKVFEYPGYMKHIQTIEEIMNSDCALFIFPSKRGNRAIAAKLFEYMASGKLILALVSGDEPAANIIRESKAGIVVPPEDTLAIRSALLDLYKKWEAGCLLINPDQSIIKRYERRTLTHDLAKVFNHVQEINK